jgi:hypothetical protein
MILAISIVECIGFGIYSAIFLWCGMQNLVRPSPDAFARLMKAGPVLGLSLGTGIFALIFTIWLGIGRFEWADHPPWAQLTFAFLFAMWVSNLVFEIWTLDPIRKSHDSNSNTDADFSRARRHLLIHCVFIAGLWVPWLTTLV